MTLTKQKQLEYGEEVIVLSSNVVNSTITMADITDLTMNLGLWWYRVEFTPFYNVNATTTGTGWNFWSWTAVITNYSFRSTLSSTATATFVNNYVSPTQDFTTTQTSRVNDNRGTIIAEFQVTTAWTLIPRFRSEIAVLNGVTLKAWSYITYRKIM